MKKYKIGLFGIAHSHARLLLADFRKFEDRFEFLGYTDYGECYDFDSRLKETMGDEAKLPFYENPNDLLALKPDIGLICSDNASHADIAISLMENGIIPIVEKPIANSMEDAIRMYEASLKTGVQLIVNWPVAWFPGFKKAKELFDEGIIGKPIRFIYRTTETLGPYCHQGPRKFDAYENNSWWYNSKCGGGALLDYCCYGSILSTYFLDECPYEVFGHKRRFMMPDGAGDVEDYAQLTLQFENTVGYAEGSWSTLSKGGIPTGPVIFGTEGTIVCDRYTQKVEVYKEAHLEKPSEVFENLENDDNIAKNLLSYLDNGTPLNPMITPKYNLWAMEVLDAGMRSCASGKSEKTRNYLR